jgi:hypothetical protein
VNFCFAFNAMIDQTYMPAEKQEINVELGLIPLIDLLEQHPKVRAALFFTGYTSQLLVAGWPDLVRRIKLGVSEGRYEIGTYTYTHPILSLIPYEDVYRQVRVGLDIDEEVWSCQPRGTILPEGSWDPSLAKVLTDEGMEWVLASPAAYLMDHPQADPGELYRPYALAGTFETAITMLFISGLWEGFWGVLEGKQTEAEYLERIERAIAAGAGMFVDKSDAEFLYLALPRLTDTVWGEGTQAQIAPYVQQAEALFAALEQMPGLQFALVSDYLAAEPERRPLNLRPGQGWKDLSEWLRGSEKVACVTDEARLEIKTADMILLLADKLGMDTVRARQGLEKAWDFLLRAETSIGRRACAHPHGQPSRIIAALEHAALAREATRAALDTLEPLGQDPATRSEGGMREEP